MYTRLVRLATAMEWDTSAAWVATPAVAPKVSSGMYTGEKVWVMDWGRPRMHRTLWQRRMGRTRLSAIFSSLHATS